MKLSVEVKDLGPAEPVAGHACNKYKVSAVLNAQGYAIPYLTGEFWIAPDLQGAKGEILAYRARYAREIGPDTSVGSNPLLQQYLSPMMIQMRAAVEALPGLALKKRLAFAIPTGGMPGAPPAAAAAAM